jgi:type VII secretion-associated protein (TIGR03931 family)
MRSHVIDIGPNSVRRLCCGGATVVDAECAFESIDDAWALVDDRPVTVVSLWRDVLASIHCGTAGEVTVVHPSWWSSARVDVVTAAARELVDGAHVRPRSWLLRQAAAAAASIVEIAADFVVIVGAEVVVESRRRDQSQVVEAVVRSVRSMAADVVIDAPAAVRGAGALAAAIAKRSSSGVSVAVVDDLRFRRLAAELKPGSAHRPAARRRWTLISLALPAALLIGVVAVRDHPAPRVHPHFPTTIAVEGHVSVEVPVDWPMRRIIAGPGSARLQFTSPADPEAALHVTQSRVALPGLDATADFLERAIDDAADGAFVDFNRAGRDAGRPVVTYREVRASHEIRWTVWVDNAVRISIGCQNRSGLAAAVDEVCALAVRSARALD